MCSLNFRDCVLYVNFYFILYAKFYNLGTLQINIFLRIFQFLLKPIFMKPYYQIVLYFKTASSITILLFNLAKNLEKQDLLYDELEKHVPKFGPVDETILCNLNYLKACIKESMR